MRPSRVALNALIAIPLVSYVAYSSITGECPISAAARGLSGEKKIPMATAADLAAMTAKTSTETPSADTGSAEARQPQSTNPNAAIPAPPPFSQTNRPGSVNLEETYDLTDLTIPREQIHTLLPKDAIPSLTDPALETVTQAGEWLDGDDRVIDVTIGSESVGVPLKILTYHEIANLVVGGQPIAATYCPLCDSVTLVSRNIEIPAKAEGEDPTTLTLEFGVSGALYNSNVLMFDRQTSSLWSQLGLGAVSGPHAGTQLELLPVRVVSFTQFSLTHPKSSLVSRETGHTRPYEGDGYAGYFATDNLMVDVHGTANLRDDIPKKTLGLGVQYDGKAWFISAEALGEGYTLQTPAGPVSARATGGAGGKAGGVEVLSMPKGVSTTQTFYYAWASFFPDCEVITE